MLLRLSCVLDLSVLTFNAFVLSILQRSLEESYSV